MTRIPTYPDSPSTLLCALCDREIGRLLGPTVQQAIADDKTGETHLAFSAAMAALRAAKTWADFQGTIVSNQMPEPITPVVNIQDGVPEPIVLTGERN